MKKYIYILLLLIIIPNCLEAQDIMKAKITVPYSYSLVRGDVPIYGYAYGKDFKEWRLEYGEGDNPREWILIAQSYKPQFEENYKANIDFSLDKTISGNLGMWDTGLTEYKYGEHKADLPIGVYTLRLTVINKKREKAEDCVQIEVGRVLLNCINNKVESPDGKAEIIVPEHSLFTPLEVVSIKPLRYITIPLPKETTIVSEVYEFNPPGMKFTQKAILRIKYDRKNIHKIRQVGAFYFDTDTDTWNQLESYLNTREGFIEAPVLFVPSKFTVFCLFEKEGINNCSYATKKEINSKSETNDLIKDDFEKDFGQWHNKYGEAGAGLELIVEGIYGRSLKISKQNEIGNLGCDITNKPFDARKYPLVSFDYKIPSHLKINFLIKVDNKWYDIVFTDDEKTYWDINMTKIGCIANVKQDDKWHHAEFNLYKMLKEYTSEFIVQEMEMADWDSTGFMKLEFGHNPIGASLYIDNFKISRSSE